MLIVEISYNFQYSWSCIELYGNKFFVYGSCMIRSFGQPGFVLPFVLLVSLIVPQNFNKFTYLSLDSRDLHTPNCDSILSKCN